MNKFILLSLFLIYCNLFPCSNNGHLGNEHDCGSWIPNNLINECYESTLNRPTDYFRSPLGIPLLLSGTFGELRNNHFHAGVDIKTQGRSGMNVYATAEGSVSRIKVSAWGYGQALYIDHPNGYTTVYAHLSKFDDAIAKYIKQKQFEKQSWELDISVPAGLLKVSKGQIVAESGNTGGSSAPHLHYEIRETITEHPVNPLLFGLKVSDSKAPMIEKIAIYGINGQNHLSETVHDFTCKKGTKNYVVNEPNIKLNANRIGIMLKTYDRLDNANNKNGPYQIQLFVDDLQVYEFNMESFSYAQSRYINAHVDYKQWKKGRSWYNKCFLEPGNLLSNYEGIVDQGLISLTEGQKRKVKILVKDVAGNVSQLNFEVERAETGLNFEEKSNFNQLFYYGIPNQYVGEGIILDFPSDAFYNDVHFTIAKEANTVKSPHSPIYKIHDYGEPVHVPYSISIHLPKFPSEYYDKAVLIREAKSKKSAIKPKWYNGHLKADSKYFGDFYVAIDTIPPTIKPVYAYAGKSIPTYDLMRFTIKDNLSGIQSYEGKLDGEWVLMEFDGKKAQLRHYFEKDLARGKHDFEVKVVDACGNKKTYGFSFTR